MTKEYKQEDWVAPNSTTVQFSDKKRETMFKPFEFMEEEKLNEIGHALQIEILQATKIAAQNTTQSKDTSITAENRIFLCRMEAFVSELNKWTTRDTGSQMSRIDFLKVDLLYLIDLQNIFCEYLQHFVTIIERPYSENHPQLTDQDGGANGPYAFEKVKSVIKALRIMVGSGTNCAFFGCIQIILQIVTKREDFKNRSTAIKRESITIYEDLTDMVETLFRKMYEQSRPFQMIFGSQEKWDTNFKKVASQFQIYCENIITNFATLTQLMLYKGGNGSQEHIKVLEEQEGCELASKLERVPLQSDLFVSNDIEDVRDSFALHASTMSLLMGQYFDLVKQQKSLFEKHVNPAKIVQNLILIIHSDDPYFTPNVRVRSLKMLEFLCELDTHPEFKYKSERSNPYFEVVLKNFQEYVSISKKFGDFYNPSNLQNFVSEMESESKGMQIDEGNNQRAQFEFKQVFASQKFLKAFLNFMFVLVTFRTRPMLTQLYPQLIDPIILILTIKPCDRSYIVNLDCQKSALQILKEISRSNLSFDNSNQLTLLIDRLKAELVILKDDFDSFDSRTKTSPQLWLPFKYDDSLGRSHTLAKRQDLIGSFLRFLCYTIIRMDPNQISINQNFVSHSRKILESHILEDFLLDLVFRKNPEKAQFDESRTRFEKVIDPIFLTCVQLCTYVFNDLHQKIGEYIANGLLPCIIESLSRRVPRQHDFLILTGKFMRLLLLNSEATKLMLDSQILANVQVMAREHEAYTEFISLYQNRDQLNLLSQLASESQELSDQMMQNNVSNLKFAIEESWRLTEHFLESEKINAQPDQSKAQIERRKDVYQRKQAEFEKIIECVCMLLLFQVHEQMDSYFTGQNETNVQRSMKNQADLDSVLMHVVSTPTICSAAPSFLMQGGFSDLITVVMILQGKDRFSSYIDELNTMLVTQIAAMKDLLGVSQLNLFDPRLLKSLQAKKTASIAEKDPDAVALLFEKYQMTAETQLWVTVAKIHAYLELILAAEAISRSNRGEQYSQVCIDYFTRPEVGANSDCLRSDILYLEELLRAFKHVKAIEKLTTKVSRRSELLERFEERIKQVDWNEFVIILEPHNDFEEALNLFYILEYAKVDTYKITDTADVKSKFRIILNAGDEDVPESSLCKKKCLFFVNRVSSIIRREKQFVLGTLNTELREFSETGAQVIFNLVKGMAEKCTQHLKTVVQGTNTLIDGLDMDLVELKLRMVPLMQEICEVFTRDKKASRSAPAAFFLQKLLDLGVLDQIFALLDWAAQVLLIFDQKPEKKLLLHFKVLHECLIAPMNLIGLLISGEFLKKGEIKYFLQPNELSSKIAVNTLRLNMMRQLVQPVLEHVVQDKSEQLLLIADMYDKDFSQILEAMFGVLFSNTFFGNGYDSAFCADQLKATMQQYDLQKNKKIQEIERNAQQNQLISQFANMGFNLQDIVTALQANSNDFERSLDQLIKQYQDKSLEETKQNQTQTVQSSAAVPTNMSNVQNQQAKIIDTSSQPNVIPQVPEQQVAQQQQQSVGNALEIEAALDLEFRQRRKTTIQMTASAIIKVFPNYLTHAVLSKRQQVLCKFLGQAKTDEDKEIKSYLHTQIVNMIESMLSEVQAQPHDEMSLPAQVLEYSNTSGFDWILIECIKWVLASDQITQSANKFAFSNIESVLAGQMQKKIVQMGALVRYEKPKKDKDQVMTDAQKNQEAREAQCINLSIQSTMFSLSQYVRVMTCIIEELKNLKALQALQQMMMDAKKQDCNLNLDDLANITNELGFQIRKKDTNYFVLVGSTEKGISRTEIDTDKVAAHLQSYFNCILALFKELNQVSGSFQENHGSLLNPIVTKAMVCLNMMANISQVGSFDFSRSFIQKNFLKVILQAKVIDRNFAFEIDAWRLIQKPNEPFINSEQTGRNWHSQVCTMFRGIIREVSKPKKELQRRLETDIKRQLYTQFLQNFKKGEQINFYEYLDTLGSSRGRSTGKEAFEPVIKASTNQSRAKTKTKVQLSKDDGFAKPLSKMTNRSKSEEKLNNQQGSKKGQQGQSSAANGQNQPLSNKLLKKLILKYDDYNESKLDDFINFNKVILGELYVTKNQDFIQACSRIAIIESVEVSDEPESSSKLNIVTDSIKTSIDDISDILARVYNQKPVKIQLVQGLRYVAEFADSKIVQKACSEGNLKMTLNQNIHSLSFSKAEAAPEETKQAKEGKKKTELRIMLKRQVLRDLIFDPDFNQNENFATYGQQSSSQDTKNAQQSVVANKTASDLTHQLLEMLVEQIRGLKMDVLKILRNPSSCLHTDDDQPRFSQNDTVLKIVKQEETKGEQKIENQKFVVDTEKSQSFAKLYFVDYAAILNGLMDILERSNAQIDTVLRHNDGKTLKFLLRNIFFIMSAHVDGKKDNQFVFKIMQCYRQEKLSDRLNIVIRFLKSLSTLTRQSSLMQQQSIKEIQRLLVSVMSKNLVQVQRHKPLALKEHNEACQFLSDSAKLVSQYNTVWLLTQFLFFKPTQLSLSNPEDALVNQAIKLDEHCKSHIVRLVIIETQQLEAKNSNSSAQQIQLNESISSLAFLSYIKKLLDNLEKSKFLFLRAKVPCMHMCIWAVTSILKMFENQPELFIQLKGPPPPDSDDEDDSESNSGEDESNLQAEYDLDMNSQTDNDQQDNALQPSGSQQNLQNQMGFAESNSQSDSNDDDDDSEEDDESGEEQISEESYGSEDFMDGNDDLSSNRGDQSLADQDMVYDQMDDDNDEQEFDLDSFSSNSDYSDMDSDLNELVHNAVIQNQAPVKGGEPPNDNSFANDRNIDMVIEAQNAENASNIDDAADPHFPEVIGEVDVGQEDESYFSEQEQESYEPPLTYDQENVSALSFNSENELREQMYADDIGAGHNHDRAAHGEMDEYEDLDNIESYSISDDGQSASGTGQINYHAINISQAPVHYQLWHQIVTTQDDPLESNLTSWVSKLKAVFDSVANSHWPYQSLVSSVAQSPQPLPAIDDKVAETMNMVDQGESIDNYDSEEPKNILDKFNQDWLTRITGLQDTKKKIQALESVTKEADTMRLAVGDYSSLIDFLLNAAHEQNQTVAQLALKAIGMIARALRNEFNPYKLEVFPIIIAKLKEKRQPLLKECQLTLESMTHNDTFLDGEVMLNIELIMSKYPAFVNKIFSPFLQKLLRRTYKDDLKSLAASLEKIIIVLCENSEASVKDYGSTILGILKARLPEDFANLSYGDPSKVKAAQMTVKPSIYDRPRIAKANADEKDDIVKLDPNNFKDKSSLAVKQRTTDVGMAQPQANAQQSSALEIEGMDPLFMESLGPQGLQNLADSHQIQNRVVNSANLISRDARSMHSNQSRYENILQTIQSQPQHMQNELMNQIQNQVQQRAVTVNNDNVDQIINAIQNSVGVPRSNEQGHGPGQAQGAQSMAQQESRGRFMSVDTIAVSMLGPNESSRQIQPQNQQHEEAKFKDVTNKVKIRGSQYMQNAFIDYQDLISSLTRNPVVSQAEVKCTEMLKQHLMPQEQESAKVKFSKIHDCMQMALIGFKIFEKDDLQIQSRIRLLFRIPTLRICLILRVLKLVNSEVENLIEHRDLCRRQNEFTTYTSKELMHFKDKEDNMLLQEMSIEQTIMVTLSIIEQLLECLQTLGLAKAATQQSMEIAQIIEPDELLGQLASLSGLGLQGTSIIQSMLSCLKRYFDTVTSDSWLLPADQSKQTQKTSLYNQVLASLRKILHPLSKVSKLSIPVKQICELVVAPTGCNKLTKQGHQHARKILNDINEKESVALIQGHLEDRLEQSLKAMITVLQDREKQLDGKLKDSNSSEKFIQLLDGVKELLKLSSGVQKFKNTNICRQETLAQLFGMANIILTKEQQHGEGSETADKAQKKEGQSSSYAFMYRNDIKEMILILFSLCEYNLRIVFSGVQTEVHPGTAEATTTLTQSPPNSRAAEEFKTPATGQMVDTTGPRQSSNGKEASTDQEMLESHAEIYRVIESQIAANQQGQQQSQPKLQIDRRLKTIIAFFISNKKLINIFIRVNQQVVNVQLKNLVVKIPQILEFDTKRLIWRVMLKKTKQKVKGGVWDISIRRDQAFDDSFALMRSAKPEEWKTQLRIAFQDEAGVDEGGLSKEWFTLLSKHMFNEDMALFLKASTGSTYFPNPKSDIQAEHLSLFGFIGKFVGKALLDQQLLECYFVKAFYKLLLDMPLDYADLEDYDQELHKSLTWILQNEGAEHLCSYFVETQDYFGENKDYELCEGGSERLVTDQNKEEYVKLVANYRLNQAIKAQITAFKTGLFTIVPKDLIKIFDNRELELLISGLQVVDIDDLRENTVYQGYTATSKPILLFWEAIREFDNSERAEFIQFVTGSSKVPVEGFKGLRGQNAIQKFTIAMVASTDQNRLPCSHTCINQLDLPQYKDKETVKRMLLTASKEGKTFAIA